MVSEKDFFILTKNICLSSKKDKTMYKIRQLINIFKKTFYSNTLKYILNTYFE